MITVTNRAVKMFRVWYRPNIYMAPEDWQYIGILAVSWLLSIGLGLALGFLWLAVL